MLSVKNNTSLSDLNQEDVKYHVNEMSYHLDAMHSSIKEALSHREKFLNHLLEFKEIFYENQ